MILSPGTGQPISVITLADAGFLEPLDDTSAGVIPEGTESLYEVDGEIYGQPTALAPVGFVYNPAAGEEVGVDEYPGDVRRPARGVHHGARRRQELHRARRRRPVQHGPALQLVSATRVYEETPDWNEQRAAGDVTFADSGWKQVLERHRRDERRRLLPGRRRGRHVRLDHQRHRRRHVADRGGPRVGGDLDRRRRRVSRPTSRRSRRPTARARSRSPRPTTPGPSTPRPRTASKASAQAFLDWVAEPEQAQQYADLSGSVPITGVERRQRLLPVYQPDRRAARVGRVHRPAQRDLAEPGRVRRPRRRRPGPADRSEDGRPGARGDGRGLGPVSPAPVDRSPPGASCAGRRPASRPTAGRSLRPRRHEGVDRMIPAPTHPDAPRRA